MAVLHLVNRSPGTSLALAQCLHRAGPGDALLLLEGGVYAALQDHEFAARLRLAMRHLAVYALSPDLEARGIAEGEVTEGISLVDYAGFVHLSLSHRPIMSWS
jgi:tRNA 2-thiouridine synthesizing protein B